jgi:hypothetical protein
MTRVLTYGRLRELLDFEPNTGIMRWRVKPNRNIIVGAIAGNKTHAGYWRIKIDGRTYRRGRLAWFCVTGRWPLPEIDHINRKRDDDRICNLREATRSQNQANRKGWGGSWLRDRQRQPQESTAA